MDPNEALKRIREAITVVQATSSPQPPQQRLNSPQQRLNEALVVLDYCFQALDKWLSEGGFLPDAWTVLDTPHTPNYIPKHRIKTQKGELNEI